MPGTLEVYLLARHLPDKIQQTKTVTDIILLYISHVIVIPDLCTEYICISNTSEYLILIVS